MEKTNDSTLRFEYLKGETLEELLDDALFANDRYTFVFLVDEYKDYIRYNAQKPVSDYDLIFQNIIVQDGNWTVIDYEWTYPESIDPEEIIKRGEEYKSLEKK